jgi:hypothetical protein
VIAVVAVLTCVAASALRLVVGDGAAAVPVLGLAWTVVFARHSRRGAFALLGAACGAVEGLTLPAAWTYWPMAFVFAGCAAYLTRRLLPVRGFVGEAVVTALCCAGILAGAVVFPPFSLPKVFLVSAGAGAGVALTGAAAAALLVMSRTVTPLRMALQKVS